MTLKNLIRNFFHSPSPPGDSGHHITPNERARDAKLAKDEEVREFVHFNMRFTSQGGLCSQLKSIPPTEVAFGTVMRNSVDTPIVQCQVHGKHCIARMYPSLQRCTRQLWHEVSIWSTLSHPNIVKFIGLTHAQYAGTHIVVTICEYYPEGSLFDANRQMARARPTGRSHDGSVAEAQRSEALLQQWTVGVASAMAYLHDRTPAVLHRNLKSTNHMLADGGSRLVVSDFATTCVLQKDMTPAVGSLRWMAPEVVNEQAYDERTDVYAFGLVCFEMTACCVPFPKLNTTQAALAAGMGNRPTLPPHCPEWLAQLAQTCWAEPPERPTFSSVHHYLEAAGQQIVARSAAATPVAGAASSLLSMQSDTSAPGSAPADPGGR